MIQWGIALSMAAGLDGSARQLNSGNALPSDAEFAAYHQQARLSVEKVLAKPEFADLLADPPAWWLALLAWLTRVAESIASFFQTVPGWLWWTIVIWLILALSAILGHFIYVLYGMIVSSAARWRPGGEGKEDRGELFGIRELDFDAVYQRARELLAAGEWSNATRYLYVAAILWLDRQGWVSFKVSKTNYDYLAELARQPAHRARFGELTDRFESTVYGGQPCTAANCQQMASQLEVLLREVIPVVAV